MVVIMECFCLLTCCLLFAASYWTLCTQAKIRVSKSPSFNFISTHLIRCRSVRTLRHRCRSVQSLRHRCRNVLRTLRHRCRSVLVPNCPGAEVSVKLYLYYLRVMNVIGLRILVQKLEFFQLLFVSNVGNKSTWIKFMVVIWWNTELFVTYSWIKWSVDVLVLALIKKLCKIDGFWHCLEKKFDHYSQERRRRKTWWAVNVIVL